MRSVYSLIYGQCSDGVRAKIESCVDHVVVTENSDPVGLLKNIKSVMFQFQATKYETLSIIECKKRLYYCRQDRDATVQEYHKVF